MVKCLTNIIRTIPRLDRKNIIFMGDFNIDIKNNNPGLQEIGSIFRTK